MGLSKEARELLYTRMYIAVSKATAETKNANGESVKTTYVGKIRDLFQDLSAESGTIAKFLWAISHKTDALPTVLFKIVDHGSKGTELSRIHSGFYDDDRNHITGTALVPFIMKAVKLYEPIPKKKTNLPIQQQEQLKQETIDYDCTSKLCFQNMSDDELTHLQFEVQKEFERRAEIREKQAKLQQILELTEMSKEELAELLEIQ